jgi:hypothetical protein
MSDTVRIQVITEENTKFGSFRDAIYYSSLAEYEAKLADGSHKAEKDARVANYVSAVENPPAPVEMTKEELEAIKLEVLNQATAQIAELDEKIASAKPQKDIVSEDIAIG